VRTNGADAYNRSINIDLLCAKCNTPLKFEVKRTIRHDKDVLVGVCPECSGRQFSHMDKGELIPNQLSGNMNLMCQLCNTDTDRLYCCPALNQDKMVCLDCYNANKK
jgi:hypothetical protein